MPFISVDSFCCGLSFAAGLSHVSLLRRARVDDERSCRQLRMREFSLREHFEREVVCARQQNWNFRFCCERASTMIHYFFDQNVSDLHDALDLIGCILFGILVEVNGDTLDRFRDVLDDRMHGHGYTDGAVHHVEDRKLALRLSARYWNKHAEIEKRIQ